MKAFKILTGILFGVLGTCVLFVFFDKLIFNKERKLVALNSPVQLYSGDIIFQTSKSRQSMAIQLATKSKYSHVGILYDSNGQYYVYEAVQPVKFTKLNDWIRRGKDGHYLIKRLKGSKLSAESIRKRNSVGREFLGKNYDLYFEWSDSRIYCSELVWKIYKEALNLEVGRLQELQDFDLKSDAVKTKLMERYGKVIPLHEKVISPVAIFNSYKLITVTER